MKQPQPSRFAGTSSVVTFKVGPSFTTSPERQAVQDVYDQLEIEAAERDARRRWADVLSPLVDLPQPPGDITDA